MKTLKQTLIALTIGLLAASFASAQDDATKRGEGRRGRGGPPAEGQGRGQMMNPEARVEQLDRALTLTADQKTKIKGIYAKTQEEMRSMMRNGRDAGGDQSANREKMQKLMQSSRDQVRALLTDEQKKKFDAMAPGGGGRGEGRSRGSEDDGKSERGSRGGKKQ